MTGGSEGQPVALTRDCPATSVPQRGPVSLRADDLLQGHLDVRHLERA